MNLSDMTKRIFKTFANSGSYAEIPQSQTDATRASYEQGFPTLNMTPIAAGGTPPSGQDFNGILRDVTQAAMQQQAIGIMPWSQEFATAIGGYPKNAVVVYNATLYQSERDGNLSQPGNNSDWQGLKVANATMPQQAVTMQQVQDGIKDFAPKQSPIFLKNDTSKNGGDITLQAADGQPYRDVHINYQNNAMHLFAARKTDGEVVGAYIDFEQIGKGLICLSDMVSAGMVSFFASQSAPTGWLVANGAAISRTTYWRLYSAIGTAFGAGDGSTTFNLPDLRGEFIRGWDNGRGVDAGRALGSRQGDAIRNITGFISGTGRFSYFDSVSGAFSLRNAYGDSVVAGGSMAGYNDLDFDASRVVPTASENRPRNVALLACIKY